jgi:hypothetical protein
MIHPCGFYTMYGSIVLLSTMSIIVLCMFNQVFYLHWSVLCFLKGEKNEQTVEKHNKLRVEVKTTVS